MGKPRPVGAGDAQRLIREPHAEFGVRELDVFQRHGRPDHVVGVEDAVAVFAAQPGGADEVLLRLRAERVCERLGEFLAGDLAGSVADVFQEDPAEAHCVDVIVGEVVEPLHGARDALVRAGIDGLVAKPGGDVHAWIDHVALQHPGAHTVGRQPGRDAGLPRLVEHMRPGTEDVRSAALCEVVRCLAEHQLSCAVEVQAGIAVDVADFRQPNHERRVGHDAVECLAAYRFEPFALAQLHVVHPVGHHGGLGEL